MMNSHCQVCQINTGKYSCPKCNIAYCSVDCYQSNTHIECSEVFYENCVREEMKNQGITPKLRKKMINILKNNLRGELEESLDSDDCDNETDLASRIASLDLNDADDIWDKLTFCEKKEFKKLVASGEIIKIIPDWEPWWVVKKKKMLIQEGKNKINVKKICPHIHIEIPDLLTLTKTLPSPFIAYMLLNILGAYVCCLRWFKGAHLEMPVESISICVALSNVLQTNYVFQNTSEALLSLKINYFKYKWLKVFEFDENVIYEDLNILAIGQYKGDLFYNIKAALCDLDCMTSKAIKILKKWSHVKRFTEDVPSLKELALIKKKIIYYLSWTIKYGNLFVNAIKDSNGISIYNLKTKKL